MAILNEDTTIGGVNILQALSNSQNNSTSFLGTTPYTTMDNINLLELSHEGDTSISYSIDSVTIGDMSNVVSNSGCEISYDGEFYKLTQTGTEGQWFQKYATITLQNLTVGNEYELYVDGNGCVHNPPSTTIGYYTVFNESYEPIESMITPGAILNKLTFNASTSTIHIRLYVAASGDYSSDTVSIFKDLYINRANTNSLHGTIYKKSGEFTQTVEIENVPSNVIISCTEECNVYSKKKINTDK